MKGNLPTRNHHHPSHRGRAREEEELTLNASNSVSLLEKGIAAAADLARLPAPPLVLLEPV